MLLPSCIVISAWKKKKKVFLCRVRILNLQQGAVVVQIRDVLEQIPPDTDVVEGHAHTSTGQGMPHVVGVAQEEHAWKGEC